MPKVKKSPKFQYGIEITKPHSKEMYDHNDMVNSLMKKNILESWKVELDKLYDDDRYIMDRDWDEDDLKSECPNIVKLQKGICWSGYGSGYSVQDVNDEFLKELDMMAFWQLEESYDDMISKGLVEKVKDKEGRTIGLVGFNK